MVIPLSIALGLSACIGLVFYSTWGSIREWLEKFGQRFVTQLDRADFRIKPSDFALILAGAGTLSWVALCLYMRADILTGVLLLPVSLTMALVIGTKYLSVSGNRRIGSFVQQLENILRMMSGALRVGLGLRQSLILVTEEVPDPARREFLRVIGRTNIGISILDALDELARNMPSQEMDMMARSIRVQATTGGDLAEVLESLATTIKERRKIMRKVSALTAQGRGGAVIIGALPLVVGGFILVTQKEMADALLHTHIGWMCLGAVAVLEGLAAFTLMKILQFDA